MTSEPSPPPGGTSPAPDRDMKGTPKRKTAANTNGRPGELPKAQPPSQDPQGGRPGKKPDHSGGAGAQSGATGHQGKRSTK